MGWCDFWDKNLDDIPGFGTPIACKAKDAAKDEVAEAAASAWEEIVHSFQEGAVWMIKELALGWLKADSPTLDASSGTVAFLFSSTIALTQWLAVLCLLIAAGRMAWSRRSEPAREAAAGIFRLVIATSAAVAVVNLLTKAGDEFSIWIVNRSLGCKGSEASDACIEAFSDKLLDMTALKDVDQLAVSLLLAVLLLISGFIQLISVIFRQSMLFVLVGTLPLAAAASTTEQGRAWWTKSLGWIMAFIAYKPAAAIIYAAAFSQFETNDDKSMMGQLYGVALLILAAVTLPALMRVVAPVVEQGGSLGGSGGGGASMASRVATGAIALKTGGASAAARGAAVGAAAGRGGGGSPSGGTTAGGGGPTGPAGGAPKGPSGGSPTPTGGSGGQTGGPTGGPSGGGGGTAQAPSPGSGPPATGSGPQVPRPSTSSPGSGGSSTAGRPSGAGGTPNTSGQPASQPASSSQRPWSGPRGSK